ncbi:hypothetical protein B0O99DRAFT_692105 [Bisporella sp. PMI_857]|nr:hypothetical protein B0O99DRAFT_692105 [Bisporella sp. PMI_857]
MKIPYQFMAIRMLQGKGDTYQYDTESFFYMFTDMCIRLDLVEEFENGLFPNWDELFTSLQDRSAMYDSMIHAFKKPARCSGNEPVVGWVRGRTWVFKSRDRRENGLQNESTRGFGDIMNQFFLSYTSHAVSKLAALAQALFTISSASSPELHEHPSTLNIKIDAQSRQPKVWMYATSSGPSELIFIAHLNRMAKDNSSLATICA